MRYPGYRIAGRRLIAAAVLAALLLPATGRGDVVRLKDGSTLKGRVLSLANDTLTIRTSFGSDLRVARSSIALVSFTDSLPAVSPPKSAAQNGGADTPASGMGRIAVTFVDDELSSKVIVERGRDREERLHANWIELLLVVDDVVVYSHVDSTMDKIIYNGPDRVYKNIIEMEDFDVAVPAGLHHVVLMVRNVGAEGQEDAFDGEPLNVSLPLDNMTVAADHSVRVKVGISRGRLRMGVPRFIRVE